MPALQSFHKVRLTTSNNNQYDLILEEIDGNLYAGGSLVLTEANIIKYSPSRSLEGNSVSPGDVLEPPSATSAGQKAPPRLKIVTSGNVWRQIIMAEVSRQPGNPRDTFIEDDFYYVCIDGSRWGRIPLVDSDFYSTNTILPNFHFDDDFIYVLTSEGWKEAPLAYAEPQLPTATVSVGDVFIEDSRFKIVASSNNSRQIAMAETSRAAGNKGDTDKDDFFYYVCIENTKWGRIPIIDAIQDPVDYNSDGFDYDNSFLYAITSEGWRSSPIVYWENDKNISTTDIVINSLPTSQPSINGQIWNNNGVLSIG